MSAFDELLQFIRTVFGVDEAVFLAALKVSPSSQGYILGAISELLLKTYLERKGFEVLRIIEKPSGGNKAKNEAARGDFYIRKKGSKEDRWLIVESKGLKSNSEFRGAKFDSPEKVLKFLDHWAFHDKDHLAACYETGLRAYGTAKEKWERQHHGQTFPAFGWNKETPGPVSCSIEGLWDTREALAQWVKAQPSGSFQEEAYRTIDGPIAVLETHQPITRVAPLTGIKQAAPLVTEFSLMSVDLFLRTRRHEFVFMNPLAISHSPTSPEHLYQNYTIDVLIKGKKTRPIIQHPWYEDIGKCILATNPEFRKLDKSQLDTRFEAPEPDI